ncbi:uncharacterized protein A4U43_C06F19430 [Asparagus officinalis]|uniref:Auxin-responsive protein n=1 Tax=Asparagus officinalis TaxID=4686 RepID=A0A5P1EN51_ASPOF|nr:auxin-induced protein 22D-like [Asparagus officinalis]ONK67366.1 uncharacterized protein A4U43_C06F19430 [Asparagus officinalis]
MEGVKSYGCLIDNLKATELRLGLPGTEEYSVEATTRGAKRSHEGRDGYAIAPVAKAQVVGWPPVRSHRKSHGGLRSKTTKETDNGGGMYVKVGMDGAPYLRKIDLEACRGYEELREGLENLFFKCFSLDYAVTYEDGDGDWMLVGDVPWGMFIATCKRLRIMGGNQARGNRGRRSIK